MNKSAFYMVLTTIFFVMAHSSIKLLGTLPLHQIIFVRIVFSFGFCLLYFRYKKINFLKDMTKDLLFRGLFGSIGMLLYFYTLTVLPLATAVTINYLSPMFAMLFAIFVIGERPPKASWFFFLLAFLGVIITKGLDDLIPWFDFIAAVMGAMFAGAAYAFVRKAGLKSDPLLVVFALPMVAMPFSVISLLVYDFVMPNNKQIGVLVFMSFLVFLAQYTMTKAYSMGEVSKVSIFNYLTIIWSILIGYFFFQENVDSFRFFGIGLIMLALLGNELYNFKNKQKDKSKII